MSKTTYGGIRRFRIDRTTDVSGVSGTGCVAQGVVFSDGTTVVRWLGKTATTTLHDSIESVEAIHLHGGHSKIRWEDPICFQCGATAMCNYAAGCDQCGASWSKECEHNETRPNPSLGKWVPAITLPGGDAR